MRCFYWMKCAFKVSHLHLTLHNLRGLRSIRHIVDYIRSVVENTESSVGLNSWMDGELEVCARSLSQPWPHAIALICCLLTLKSWVAIEWSISDRHYFETIRLYRCIVFNVNVRLVFWDVGDRGSHSPDLTLFFAGLKFYFSLMGCGHSLCR